MAVLKPGEIDDDGNWLEYDGMARYIEEALPPPDDPEDSGKFGRRQFFIAISTGVIEYLKVHQGNAFVVHLNTDVGTLEIR
jgi:hypothetical protein